MPLFETSSGCICATYPTQRGSQFNEESEPTRSQADLLFASFFWNWFHRSDESASWRWALAIALILGFMAVLGSVLTVLAVGCGVVAWTYWCLDRERFRFSQRDKLIAGIFMAYIGNTLFFALIHPNPLAGAADVVKNSLLLLSLALFPVLRDSYQSYWLNWIRLAIAGGGVASGVGAATSNAVFGVERAELLAGNALVFSYLTGALLIFNLLIAVNARQGAWLYAIGAIMSGVAMLYAASRGPILVAAVLALAILLVTAVRLVREKPSKGATMLPAASAMILAALALTYFTGAFNVTEQRFGQMVEQISTQEVPGVTGNQPSADVSLMLRLAMLRSGWHAFLERPFTGYGIQNTVSSANAQFDDDPEFQFNHLHNAFLTEGVGSGILGVIFYILVLLTPVIAAHGLPRPQWETAAIFAIYVAGCAAVNVGFYHDIFTAYFAIAVATWSALPRNGGTSAVINRAIYRS